MDLNILCKSCLQEKGADEACSHCGYQKDGAAESLLHLPPGTMLRNKYLIGRVLGQGGFGITYLALDTTLNLKLAIKEYLPQQMVTRYSGHAAISVYKESLMDDFNYGLTKFLEEARTLARFVENPNFVSVRDYFEENNTAYMAMNYIDGITLIDYLESKGGKVGVDEALSIFMPIFDALKEIHSTGILHRDISPDNILINRKGQIVLIDFGAARQAMNQLSKGFSIIMKAGFSPEEQYRSKGEQGPWTDVYAVAATLYRCITGWMPPESLDRLVEDKLILPSDLGVEIFPYQEKALMTALSVKAKDRYQSIEDFQEALYTAKIVNKVISPINNGSSGSGGIIHSESRSHEVPKSYFSPYIKKIAIGFGASVLIGVLAFLIVQFNSNNEATTENDSSEIANIENDTPLPEVTLLLAPRLISPINLINNANEIITFYWNPVENAEYYWLTIINNSNNTTLYDGNVGAVTEFTWFDFPSDGTEFTWRVAAGKDQSGLSDWSEDGHFVNGSPPVSSPKPVPAPTPKPAPAPAPEPPSDTPLLPPGSQDPGTIRMY
jgi:serine/threonine protein kinase